jgi:hypothetical protein
MAFAYCPLLTNDLRLLRPIHINNLGLAFEISHHPREAAPPYTAVSYTWGDGAPTEPISINEQIFPIRVNLWFCLYYLGQAIKFGTIPCKYLWVDAICIDQGNNQERKTQVLVMDQIYRKAITVSVWLGLPPMSEHEQAFLAESRESINEFHFDDLNWFDAMKDLSNRPYWGRFWVIQEFLLAQDVRLFCANTSVDWLHFRDLLAGASDVHDDFSEDVNYTQSSSGPWAAWPLVAGRHPDKHPELQQTLYKLLITHSDSKCKDPRDRVFALLGLVTPREKDLLERFLPDYNMSEDNVVLIALCHIQLDVYSAGPEQPDLRRALLALGVDSNSRQQRLIKRSRAHDYLGDEPPSTHWDLFEGEEDNEFDAITWRDIVDPACDASYIRDWGDELDARSAGRRSCCPKRTAYALGMIVLLVLYLGVYQPQVCKSFVSLISGVVTRIWRFVDSCRSQSLDSTWPH